MKKEKIMTKILAISTTMLLIMTVFLIVFSQASAIPINRASWSKTGPGDPIIRRFSATGIIVKAYKDKDDGLYTIEFSDGREYKFEQINSQAWIDAKIAAGDNTINKEGRVSTIYYHLKREDPDNQFSKGSWVLDRVRDGDHSNE